MPSTNAAGTLRATLTPTGEGLSVDRFVDLGPTPGNVGICLSGGGSRAMTAGMGQLRALLQLTTPDGKSLISQARVLSTVSGGSWIGVPFEYLTAGTSDQAYLNGYVADPARLVPTRTAGHSPAETLDQLPTGNAGEAVASPWFGPVQLALQVLLLRWIAEVPGPFLWQTAVALHVLERYGLYKHGKDFDPTSFFSFDKVSLDAIRAANPALADETAHLVAGVGDPSRARRPFLVCNCSMFLVEPGTEFQLLAPVQATAFTTGIFGRPKGKDQNGRVAGGGGVTSFAFSSDLAALDGDRAAVEQPRQLALSDIVGTSSAFFAEVLQNLFKEWRADPSKAFDAMMENMDDVMDWSREKMPSHWTRRAFSTFGKPTMMMATKVGFLRRMIESKLAKILDEIQELIPEYAYWPVLDAAPAPDIKPTRFADGGVLENTGVANLLSYSDVDSVIACVNSNDPLAAGAKGVIDAQGNELPGTRVVVSAQIAQLFGYQGYDSKRGYVLYAGDANPSDPVFMVNQVFPSPGFADFLRQIWSATGNDGDPASLGVTGEKSQRGADAKPAIVRQRLAVLDNAWFGVSSKNRRTGKNDRTVTIVWVYNNAVRAWYDQLRPEVQQILGSFEDPKLGFPNVSTLRTHLPTAEVNLLASLNAWCVANPDNAQTFVDLFQDPPGGG